MNGSEKYDGPVCLFWPGHSGFDRGVGGRFCLLCDALRPVAQADRRGRGGTAGIFGMESEKTKRDGTGTGVREGVPYGAVVSVIEGICGTKKQQMP